MEKTVEKVYSPSEYAHKIGVSLKTVYNMIKDGRVKTKKFYGKTLVVE